jgi:hypothetical protein
MLNFPRLDGTPPQVAPDPEDVDLLLDFSEGEWIPHYSRINLANNLMRFSNAAKPTPRTIELVKSSFSGISPQEAISFHGDTYFVEGAPLKAAGPTIVYRFAERRTAEIDCVMRWNR